MNAFKWSLAVLSVGVVIGWLTISPVQVFEFIIKTLIDVDWNVAGDNVRLLRSGYDFVIIGAGTAGCVIANRLSENPNWTILLIEAGPDETTIMDIPAFVHFLQTSDRINWKYQTEPSDKYCLAMTDGQCNWPRGKVMGGSSVLNYMIYTRGNRRDYDHWSEMGASGWSFNEVEPYFKKLENSTIQSDYRTDDNVLGRDGPVSIAYVDYKSKVSSAFVDGVQEMGLDMVDYNGQRQIGVSYVKSTTKSGYRHSSNRAYIDPIKNQRPNLHIKRNSIVTKILMDNDRKTTGVVFVENDQRQTVTVRKEVIVSAGAINSPQLLMLSGIGPAEHLRAKGIEPIVDRPVGRNLMDHYTAGTFTFKVNVTTTKEDVENVANWRQYFRNGSGPLGVLGGCEAIAFFNTEEFHNKDAYPDVEVVQVAGALYEAADLIGNFNFEPKMFEEMYGELRRTKQRAFSMSPFLLRPKSRGEIRLRTSDPFTYPMIVPNYFGHPYDMRTMIRAVRQMLKLEKTKAFRKINATLHRDNLERCKDLPYDGDDYWDCYLRHMMATVYHYSGTCKMGADTDRTAVVNGKLQVIGVRNLRVADASVMPEIISGHPNAAVLMIGEKVSDMIKSDWVGLQSNHS